MVLSSRAAESSHACETSRSITMEVSSQSDSIIADLRRAAIPGALGSAVDRNADVLVDAGALSGVARFVPNPAPLAVAIDGPGLFVLQEGAERAYGRLGDFR